MPLHIDSYRFGNIVIDNQTYTKDLIIFPNRVMPRWRRKQGHNLYPEDIQTILDAKPDILIVGQGAYGMMKIAPATKDALATAGIALQAYATEQACTHYNELSQTQGVIAALHLTC